MFNRLARFAYILLKAKRSGINSEKNLRSTTAQPYKSRYDYIKILVESKQPVQVPICITDEEAVMIYQLKSLRGLIVGEVSH